jgi:hypothetical protein
MEAEFTDIKSFLMILLHPQALREKKCRVAALPGQS